MPRARLEDVAARAGVSTATASLVLRDRPGPSQATRERVREAANAVSYRPDRSASLLARHRTQQLGVLLDVTSPFHGQLVGALDEAAADRGFDLVLGAVTPRHDEGHVIETLLDHRCEGLVLLGSGFSQTRLAAVAARCPTVVVGRAGTPSVAGARAPDDQGLRLAVDHLVDLGHERIAFVDGPRGSISTARRRGYREAMAAHHLRSHIDVLAGGSTEAAGSGAAERVLARSAGTRPTALVCFNDRCAVGLRDRLLRRGVGVPGEISVVGYDDSPPAALGTIDLTSVSQDPVGLAAATISLLSDLVEAGSMAGRKGGDVVVSPRLVVRSSTAPVSSS
ncbi:LacI family DNA-binding transcriptional regulator [Knoellia sp. S7-12]|uniref:LacI family DNA-binding transcriptional regulator n=1 Tax=Knoellia sp. S7-12 TaxID=3126698 RepID=UPI003368C8CE